MKVIVQEDHGIPNVAMYFFYRIGSRNERPGTTGAVPLLRAHDVQRRQEIRARKCSTRPWTTNGGNNNAYTSNDVTVYTDWFPSSALELMFDMEADRIRDLAFDPKIIESERGVVYSERRMSVDNNNMGALRELADATAFVAHPYHWPVVGWPSDIESWSMEDLKAHWTHGLRTEQLHHGGGGRRPLRQHHGAGEEVHGADSAARSASARAHQGTRAAGRAPRDPAQAPRNCRSRWCSITCRRPTDPDTPVLDVISTLLTGGQSSRLYRRMVDTEQLALSVNGSVGDCARSHGRSRFMIQPRSGVDPADHREGAV